MFYRYDSTRNGFFVVTSPMGAAVPVIPPSYTVVTRAGVTYYSVGGTYYQSEIRGGRTVYVVACF